MRPDEELLNVGNNSQGVFMVKAEMFDPGNWSPAQGEGYGRPEDINISSCLKSPDRDGV